MSGRRCTRRCAERRSLCERLNQPRTQVGKWTTALGDRKFMGGEQPNLAGECWRALHDVRFV